VVVNEIVNRLAGAWRQRVGTATRQAALALFFLALVGGAHLARIGTLPARLGTAALLVGAVVILVYRAVRARRVYYDLRRTLAEVLLPTDRALGERVLRAVTLVDRTEHDTQVGSTDLARLHFERLLRRASVDAVEHAAERRSGRWRVGLLVALGGIVLSFALGPMRVVEGLDVLLAHHGRAPMPLAWLDYMRVTAEPPSYLRMSERIVIPGMAFKYPEGTLLTVRGVPRRSGEKLVLTDGHSEVAFVGDGSGGVVARWSLERSGTLRVAARFGDVLVEELESLPVQTLPDETPVVSVQGAPKTLELEKVDSIDVRYEASDDHGLRQIDLVLRAGDREDRRVLARLDGESTFEQGGHSLSPRDPFLRRMFLPVMVTVEARDNDPIRGPKWGRSPAITLVPPVVGAPEAGRYRSLVRVRDMLTDFLGYQMPLAKGKETIAPSAEERDRARRVADAMSSAVDRSSGSLGVPRGLGAFLLGQMRVLERPLRVGESRIRRTEDVLLAVDVAVRALGARDAQTVSKRLADVVEEIANGAKQARDTENRPAGVERLDAALVAAEKGVPELSVLGPLGHDLGSVAVADLGRVKRARKADDLFHTELAARHLAARLRRPNPSFGGARRGGVESGTPGANGTPSGEASDANDRFDQLANELEQLAREHGAEIGNVERALADAEQGVNLDDLRDEAKQRADTIRRAIAGLPQSAHTPGTARASAALGREHGSSMAESLERLSLGDAVQSGRDALSALEDAHKKVSENPDFSSLDEQDLAEAKRRVKEQLSWAEQRLGELKQSAALRARAATSTSSEREQKFAQRAGNLASRGKHGETALPDDAVDDLEKAESIMREAARALSEGKVERGLDRQREAQRLLERANTGQTGDDDEGDDDSQRGRSGSRGANGKGVSTGGQVPGAEDKKRAEDFRRRVLEGLGKSNGGRLAPAVKRYAEGLLR
jgi:hypothetical protein